MIARNLVDYQVDTKCGIKISLKKIFNLKKRFIFLLYFILERWISETGERILLFDGVLLDLYWLGKLQ